MLPPTHTLSPASGMYMWTSLDTCTQRSEQDILPLTAYLSLELDHISKNIRTEQIDLEELKK